MQSQLFGLSPFDVSTMAAAVLAISAVVLIAAYLPAHRAACRSHGRVAIRVKGNRMNGFLQDLRYALRQLRKSPASPARPF